MSITARFSRAIYYARKEMGLTQERAAEALNISVRWYQAIENGKCLPSAELALRIVSFFNIHGEELRDFIEELL